MNNWAGHLTDSTKENRKYLSSKMSKWTLTGLQLLQENPLCCFKLRDLFFQSLYISLQVVLENFARVRICWPLIDCLYPSNTSRRLWWHSTMKLKPIKTSGENLVWEQKCREFKASFPVMALGTPPSETQRVPTDIWKITITLTFVLNKSRNLYRNI